MKIKVQISEASTTFSENDNFSVSIFDNIYVEHQALFVIPLQNQRK